MDNKKTEHVVPKLNSQFLVEFPGEFNIEQWTIREVNKPYMINGQWGDIKVVFTDGTDSSASKGLVNIINTFRGKSRMVNKPLFNIKIKSLDTDGNVVESWVVQVKDILRIDFGYLSYDNLELQQPYIILIPLECSLWTKKV